MSARKCSYAFFTLSSVFVLWPASPATFAAALAPQAQSQMRQRATRAAAGPIKLDVQPDAASAPIRSKVSLKVFMRNADLVAPVRNLTGDPDQQYLMEAFTDDLVTDLLRHGRGLSLKPLGDDRGPADNGNRISERGYDYIVTGSAQTSAPGLLRCWIACRIVVRTDASTQL